MPIKTGGLQQLPKDERDFSHTKVMGGISKLPLLPPTYTVGTPLAILDQLESDECTCFASAGAIEHTEGVVLDPHYLFANGKAIEGNLAGFGLNLRTAARAACKVGLLEQSQCPFSLQANGRDFIAQLSNWPDTLKWLAAKHQQKSYVSIDGAFDHFDNIRLALWNGGKGGNPIITGALWRSKWTDNPIINAVDPQDEAGGHAFFIRGWVEIDKIPYLYAQLSNGEEIGDRGFYYISRDIANKELTYGTYQFVDMSPVDASAIHVSPWPAFTRFILNLKHLLWH